MQISAEHRGKDYSGTVTLGNPDLINESGELLSLVVDNVYCKHFGEIWYDRVWYVYFLYMNACQKTVRQVLVIFLILTLP